MMQLLSVSMAQEKKELLDKFITARPLRCIALHQGQTCYQFTHFSWQTDTVGDYCLYEKNSDTLLKCWQNKSSGSLKLDFQSPHNLTYVLREKTPMRDIAYVEITVAWVYKSKNRPQTNWRLF